MISDMSVHSSESSVSLIRFFINKTSLLVYQTFPQNREPCVQIGFNTKLKGSSDKEMFTTLC